MATELILGCPVTTHNQKYCIEKICKWLECGVKGKLFFCANPHSLVVAEDDSKFKDALTAADLLIPDGIGIVLASKILNGTIRGRVTGSDIFWGLSQELNSKKADRFSYFFLGSTGETLVKIKEKMALEFPHIQFAGSYSPPYKQKFSVEDSRLMVEAVNVANPDVLWVGMTAPKQEKWVRQHCDQLNVIFTGAIGAVFDFYAGNVKRSPPVFQKMGLEWLPRLIQEPRRLFRRNFVSSPLFLQRVVKQRVKK